MRIFIASITTIFISFFSSWGESATIVGNDCTGVWDTAGSPYVVASGCTVPKGQKLTINPGVEVVIGQDQTIEVLGDIIAIGTRNNRIKMKGSTPNHYWEKIYLNNSFQSEFAFCDLSDAKTAIYMEPIKTSETMSIKIQNCHFSNCIDQAIYAEARGWWVCPSRLCSGRHPHVDPIIDSCIFESTGSGSVFNVSGTLYYTGLARFYSYGHASPTITNSIFIDLQGAALKTTYDQYPDGCDSYPVFANNIVINSNYGVLVQNPYDATINNNIFYGNETGIEKTGGLSRVVSHNSFFENTKNFVGYPVSYGQLCCLNSNGDDCDLLNNIYLDPRFIDTSDTSPLKWDIHLSDNSPCIDAGTADGAPDKDVDGDSRPRGLGYDIGADEYSSATNSAKIIGTWDSGIWYWDVAASRWTHMTSSTPTGDIAAGDFTGDGKADVASIWASGLWYQDGATLAWIKVTDAGAVSLTAGDVTGDDRAEIIGTWDSGIWYWDVAVSKWTQMTSSIPTGDIAAGDFTGDGKADVASCWNNGLWYQDGATLDWTKVSSQVPAKVTAGDVTGDGRAEIIGAWNNGIWYFDVVKTKWTEMTSGASSGDIAAGDFTGDSKADVASCWKSGLWYQNGATLDWTKVSSTAPTQLTVGDENGD